MPSPPISPTPRRPQSDYAALLSSFEGSSTSEDSARGSPGWTSARESLDEGEGLAEEARLAQEFLTAPPSPRQQTLQRTPVIRTISPSPQREDVGSPSMSARSSDERLSPSLPSGFRGQLFGESSTSLLRESGLIRNPGPRGDVPRPRESPSRKSCMLQSSYRSMLMVHGIAIAPPQQPVTNTPSSNPFSQRSALPTPPSDPTSVRAQTTGTIDAAYDGVFSQLDALAGQGATQYSTPPSTSSNPSKPSARSAALPSQVTPTPESHPELAPPVTPFVRPVPGLGTRTPAEAEISRLSSVSERTEPDPTSSSARSSPTGDRGLSRQVETVVESTTRTTTTTQYTKIPIQDTETPTFPPVIGRLALPASPVRGPRPPAPLPQSSPTKASELIRLFEARAGGPSQPSPPQPQLRPTVPDISNNTTAGGRGQPHFELPPPLSSFRQPFSSLTPIVSTSPPPKSPSPLSQVRTMIASWRARAASPSQRVQGSPGRARDTPRLFGRDRGWNVSIRRRRRDEGVKETGLAEQGVEPTAPTTQYQAIKQEREVVEGEGQTPQRTRTPSVRSLPPSAPRAPSPRALTGEVRSISYDLV